jgi:hypothetical protein
MRKSAVAGQFYPAGKKELSEQLRRFIDFDKKKNNKIKGIIVPHAGYFYSGKCVGEVYSLLDASKIETFIIFAVNHSGIGNNLSLSLEDFETLLGIVKNNKKISSEITNELKKEGLDAGINENAHRLEHSLEVQLPFLQYIYEKGKNKDFNIVPILASNVDTNSAKIISGCIYSIVKKNKIEDNCLIIASSDFTHYGESYGFVPFRENIKENLFRLDLSAIKDIEKLNTKEFLEKSEKTTICGSSPISVAIELSRLIGAKQGKLVDYYTSGDISGDYTNAVGYAGIVFV